MYSPTPEVMTRFGSVGWTTPPSEGWLWPSCTPGRPHGMQSPPTAGPSSAKIGVDKRYI